jgi:hypothetical protein
MKRFLMLVGVAAVAAAMYVAASPASQQSRGPTLAQFNALKAKVTSQGKTIKQLKQFAALEATFLTDCVKLAVPIDQFGDGSTAQTEGYNYSQPAGVGNFLTTALDVTDPAQDTGALFITGGDASCGTLVNGTGLRRAAAKAGVRVPSATAHRWSFTAHH